MNNTQLIKYLKKFNTESLAKAIYSITSWIPNRMYIGAADYLNKLFIEIEEQGGDIEISSYEDLKKLYRVVKKELELIHDLPEMFTSDIGEVQFYSGDSFKKIFIGNGSEDIYNACFLIESIVGGDEYLEFIWQQILDYENFILSYLYSGFSSHSSKFECPPKKYFETVVEHFDSLNNNEIKLFFQNFKSINTELYSFFTPINGYPIFLPLLKESFLEIIENQLSKEKVKELAWDAVINQLNDNYFPTLGGENHVIPSIVLINNETKKKRIIKNSIMILNISKGVVFVPDDLSKEILQKLQFGMKDEKYSIQGWNEYWKSVGGSFQLEKDMIVQKVDDVDLSPNFSKEIMISKNDDPYLDIEGLMGIINFASNINEIIEFINFIHDKENVEKTINASGMTSYFQIWQDLDKVIIEGSQNPMIVVPPYQSVEKTVEFFRNDLKNYPYDAGIDFSKIHHWNVVTDAKSDLLLVAKGNSRIAEVFKTLGKVIVYQELHFILEDIEEEILETTTSFREIILNELNENKDLVSALFRRKVLAINLVSESVLKKNAKLLPVINSKYFKKIIINIGDDIQILLVRPKWDKIADDNFNSKEKAFENELIFNLLSSGDFNNETMLEKGIRKSDSDYRTSAIGKIEIPYYIEPHLNFVPPEDSAFKNVRKVMSKVIEKLELEIGTYEETKILDAIRRFRNEIRNDLVTKIKSFDKLELHKKLLTSYSKILFQINIHQERLNKFGPVEYLSEDSLNEFRGQVIKLRELSKVYRQSIEYLMEENLVCERPKKTRAVTNQDLDVLIAYSKWLLDFQMMSDSVSYGASGWNKLKIREDHIIEIQATDKYIKDAELLKELRYLYGDYSFRDKKIDKQMWELADESFQTETQISFKVLFTILKLLYSNHYINEIRLQEGVQVSDNIIEVPINTIANLFIIETEISIEELFKVIAFITIREDLITNNDGVIPIWEKKKRKNKISAQPVLAIDNKLIFSPISLYELEKNWLQGTMNFILPYNISLEKTTKVIDEWKTHYEKKIVKDLSSLFQSDIYEVYSDKEIYKLDPKGNHPRNLGDYDLIVINKEKKEVLIFEVKYMRLSQTTKDALGDQSKYFLNNKAKAIKFERRVLYFQNHLDQIMNNLGHGEEFVLKKYFLSNKNIRTFFKDYSFEVIGFNEFRQNYFK